MIAAPMTIDVVNERRKYFTVSLSFSSGKVRSV
jgi:hypothetical protein